jgi:hypothetical protein
VEGNGLIGATAYFVFWEYRISLGMNLLFQIIFHSNLDAIYSAVTRQSQIARVVIFE